MSFKLTSQILRFVFFTFYVVLYQLHTYMKHQLKPLSLDD